MQLSAALTALLVFVLYPLWLTAGGVDYWCHRRTAIERTSGVHESDYHVVQFVTMLVIIVGAALLEPTFFLGAVLGFVVLLHTLLSYLDVRYTQSRRYISPLEQHAHAFMDVLPIVAVLLIALLGMEAGWVVPQLRDPMPPMSVWIVASFLIFAGAPVFEEWIRTTRASRARTTSESIAAVR